MRLFHAVVVTAFVALLMVPNGSFAQVSVGVSITVAPPPLPVYTQPPIPAPGYIWTPGYWAYGPDGYYWIPGTWVEPPAVGLLWTPAYWGWEGRAFVFHPGYWGPHVGFYGGINYGFGYTGVGYLGGYWSHGVFAYNRTVNNIRNVHVTNIYTKTVVNNVSITRTSYNGGAHGTKARPTTQQTAFTREQHAPPTPMQTQHEHAASGNHGLLASTNHGRPPVAATSRAGEFEGNGTVPARRAAARTNTPATHPQSAPQAPHFNSPAAQPQHGNTRPPEHGGGPPDRHEPHGGQPDDHDHH